MFETIVIFLVFIAAVFYLTRNTFKSFFSKSNAGCAKGCGSCKAIDFEEIMAKETNKTIADSQ